MQNNAEDERNWASLLNGKGKYISLGTRKRDGSSIRTPVWFVRHDEDLVVTTSGSSGKAKRIRNFPVVDVALCDMRGKISGPLIDAAAEILSPAETESLEKLFVQKFRLTYRLMLLRGGKHEGRVFIRITRNELTPHA